MGQLREQTERAACELRKRMPKWAEPVAVVQLGTGFVADGLFDETLAEVKLADLSDMPDTESAVGHPLKAVLGTVDGRQFLLLHGHLHLHEGHGVEPVVLPICAAVSCGVRNVYLLSTASAVREDLKPGTWVALTDYVNQQHTSPLIGNADLLGIGFLDVSEAFSQPLISELINAGDRVGIPVRMGIYESTLGPQLPTPAEVAIARAGLADVFGHSVVQETIAACALGARVAAFTLVTHRAAVAGAKATSLSDIERASEFASAPMMRALRSCLAERRS